MPADTLSTATERLHLIAFDVADDRRRYRLTRLLQRYGERVQESVFEAWMSAAQRGALLSAARGILHSTQDRLVCYALTGDEARRIRTMGCGRPVTPNPDFHLV
ncbi:CRISPR-associated Cas2 family protein [Tibeticola sediminis]|jgi:CRISPR-associated protein Cas2|uniref:CRISPR-associated endoribonuclease Cas2 n=1 Tax=Tibeticola sediminis TaxID=1917811 RepID=A0A3N4UCL8_9BURK|nr:CRISPR-associated endonuclease Cas2 [Tibeticola sediminis]RPE63047.1 CRISPR-associated Cas2 family protein [Tibeticola sediminis]